MVGNRHKGPMDDEPDSGSARSSDDMAPDDRRFGDGNTGTFSSPWCTNPPQIPFPFIAPHFSIPSSRELGSTSRKLGYCVPDKAKRRKRQTRSSINAMANEGKDIMRLLAELKDQMREQSMQLTKSNSEIHKQMGNLIESQNGQSKEMEKLIESQNGQSKVLEKLIESQNGQSKELEKLTASIRKQLEFHTNITGHAESDAPRSQMNQMQTPRYRLEFRSAPTGKIITGETIEISVALVETINGQAVENGPLASATVELVVVNAEFNRHDSRHYWPVEDFERNIVKPRKGADQSVNSIVSNGRFNLVRGAKCYSGSAIFENSQNKKVRLGAMLVLPTGERVLEALSYPLLVRDHVQTGKQSNLHPNSSNRQRSNIIGGQSQLPARGNSDMLSEPSTSQELHSSFQQFQNPHVLMLAQATYNQNGQALGDNEYQEQNNSMPNMQQPPWSNLAQTGPIRSNIIGGQSQLPVRGNSNMLSTEPSTSQQQHSSIQQYQNPHVLMLAQATYNQNGELASELNYPVVDPNFMCDNHDLGHAIDMQFRRIMPLELVWDCPNVGPIKCDWNLLDQFMPLPKFNNCGLPTECLMQEHLVYSRIIMSKEVMQARRNTGVIIEPLEPDDSDEERQLKRKMRRKYQLRFVNKVCEGYHIMDPIKADDGSLLKVALFDGNRKITNGPLSSASVQIIVLHGDFNDHGQDYWTSEEFNCYEVCPQPGEEASSVLGGDCVLVLFDGEACLGDAFFQMTSYCARTGKFKMGVRLTSAQEERIQEGVSEAFWVKDRHCAGECGLGIGPEDDSARLNHPSVVQVTMDELVTEPPLYTLKNRESSYRYNVMKGPYIEDVVLDDGSFLHDIDDAVEEADGKLKEIDERRSRYGLDDRVPMANPAATPSSMVRGGTDASLLIGIDEAKKDALVKMLSPDDDISMENTISEVATGEVYQLQPLSEDDSKRLFYTRIPGGEDNKCPDNQKVSEVPHRIPRKCSGHLAGGEILAGFLVCPIIKIVVKKARSCASDRMKWLGGDGVPNALQRLENTLYQLHAVASAVQRRGSPDRSGDLRAWLQQLMDAVYEADDVLDDFDDSVPPPGSSVAKFAKRLFGFGADERVNRLKDVVEKLVAIHAGSPALLAATETIASASVARGEPIGSTTGPMRHHEDAVFGRDKELREMVSWLAGASDAKSVPVPVAAIVGLGGMGKTTLAQLLFNDPEVASTFDLKIWVHSAAKDDELELAKKILQSTDVDVPDGKKGLHWLHMKLKEKISSRKFLLVIDDVWNREDMMEFEYRNMWSKVLAPLSYGNATGSKIVVTTRQKIVATSLGAREFYLGDLPANGIWSLFTKYAFGDQDLDKQPPELRAIGRKIAEKLRGSPLAAKAVAQMLEGSRSVTHWRKVLEMDVFDVVSKTLELSYRSLPEHLQPCFAICSLFPKNWRFKRDKLVKIWMALDFIQADSWCGKTRLEDVGSVYFDQLVDRSFFHRLGRYYYIHSLMHDLADKVSRFDCLRAEDAKKETPKTIRHLSVSSDIVMQLIKDRCDLKKLRTLLILKNPSSSLDQLPGDLFIELKGLRVLSLEGCNIVRLSEQIVNLKYLRYLALCKSINRLPLAVTQLYRLQTFSSPKGSDLEVPADIVDLKRLRHLDMDTSKITGIGKLVHLQGSVKFHVKNEKGHTLGDLDNMSGLRKELHITNLDVVKDKEEACQAGINKKENVMALELEWNSTCKSAPSDAAEVLDGLEPHQYVKKLIIRRYHGNRSPNWLSESLKASDFYIKYLHLINCRKWEVMPPLGQLPCLKVLQLKEMCSVKRISCDFYGTKLTAFPSLEELEFDDLPRWVEWTHEEKNIEVFPKLRKLRLLNCPELIKVPHLPLSVRNVKVKNTGFVSQMKLSFSSPSKACKFALDTCSATVLTNGLMHQQQVEAIAILTLRNCEDVKFEELQVLTSLKRLQISHSSINDEQLGTCLRGLQALTWLEISNCNNITSLPWMENSECLTKFHELHIQQCPEVSSLHSLPSFAALESILIENCSKVTMESFPTNFNNSSLRRLSIINCAELESLPSGFPSSLQVLHLIGCKPTLMTKLQVKDGPEWDKIASIPFKQIC